MSKYNDIDYQLQEIDTLEIELKAKLHECQGVLHLLFNQRESFIRSVNRNRWDLAQYELDDLQQKLSDVSEELEKIAPVASLIENLIAP